MQAIEVKGGDPDRYACRISRSKLLTDSQPFGRLICTCCFIVLLYIKFLYGIAFKPVYTPHGEFTGASVRAASTRVTSIPCFLIIIGTHAACRIHES